ncbi:MAG: PQQ-binding-like beta-propeller repeat protein [bacterium]
MRSTIGIRVGLVLTALILATPRGSLACVGDCNGDRAVSIDELIRAVQITLGDATLDQCDAVDNNRDGQVTVNELIRGVTKGLNGCGGGPADAVLFSLQDNQLDEYDLARGWLTDLVPSTRAHVNGQPCLLPDGSGNFIVGEDTGQPEVRPGWGIFSPEGTFLKKITLPERPDEAVVGDPIGCAIDAEQRLFGTAIGTHGGSDGQLVVFFPPDYQQGCILDQTLHTPGIMTIDDAGALYVPEAGPPGKVSRLTGPFPASPAECGSVVPTKTPFISYADAVASLAVARGHDGHFFVSNVVGLGDATAGIREHDADGSFIRELLPAGDWGNPAGLAFDADGSLYYADLGLNAQNEDVAGAGTVRKISFDAQGRPSEPELMRRGLSFPDGVAVLPSRGDEWLTLGGGLRRVYFNPRERILNPTSAPNVIAKWKYLTNGMITAQPAVTWVDLPGEGRTQIVITSAWDGFVYTLRAENGSLVWRYQRKPHPGASYPFAGAPSIAWIDGQQRVFVPGGETMYSLDATTGAEIWQFDAGTGCTNCTEQQERTEIESTPAVIDGKVIFGMDVNDSSPGKGGMYGLDARDGRLVWYFDMEVGSTCRPLPSDNVRRYDGFHTAAELGLPADFFSTRPGCDHPRTSYECGNVWSSPAIDARRGLLYIASSNCDTDTNPDTPKPSPPMPPYDEALFALTLDGEAAWVWRPREVDNDDLSFGAVPNLFEVEIGGALRDVVGIGNKDGTYYLLDRDGVNALTGSIEPYWSTNVVPGGPIGGIIGSASVGDGKIVFSSGFGLSISHPQKPAVHALDPSDGSILWENSDVDTSYAPCSGVPGLALCGSTPRPNLNIFTRDDGTLLKSPQAAPVPSGVACGAAITGGQFFVGAGTGAFNEGSDAEREARRDTPISAFCVGGTPGCTTNTCTDGNLCTYDYRNRAGTCTSEPAPDGIDCKVGTVPGNCVNGACVLP